MATYLKQRQDSPLATSREVAETVSTILREIEQEGVPAIRRWSERLDGWAPERFVVDADAVQQAAARIPDDLRQHIVFAKEQVEQFAALQRATLTDLEVETLPGVVLGHHHIPVRRVGSYSPGGRYPLIASCIMTIAVPRVAGVGSIVACAPPAPGGQIYDAQLFTMALCGADLVLCLGGVQALAAMAFGLESEGVEPVDMIVGAGNAYVAEAKRQLFGRVGIDLLAGPTEVLVIADERADPRLVAADLLGQAEHGPNSPAILVTTDHALAVETMAAVEQWLSSTWPTAEVAGAAWRACGEVVVCDSREEAVAVSDRYAPEHLEIHTTDPQWFEDRLTNYGSLFVGRDATVAYGDKAIGVNHVLPTSGAARYTGGLWVGKFLKTCTYQRVTPEGSQIVAPPTAAISDAEHMEGHALTARLRLGAPAPT